MTEATTPTEVRGRERTRARLLDAAAGVFAEVGLDAASVEAICERAGFTRGAFYSNFESKDELMLAVTAHISEQKIELVNQRVRELAASGERLAPAELVQRMLDVAIERRAGILLTSEIRTRAMRDPRLADAYLAWQGGMVERVAQVIGDLGRTYGLRLRLPPVPFAQLILQSWEDAAVNAVIAGADFDEVCAIVNQRTAAIAVALVDPA